ncbi:MAG: SpoIIE family protein phosphatase, partial [Desulfobacterales bacterium]|nr:SpoIIE family protein phosphatase [Desulfobacterales bacterium]
SELTLVKTGGNPFFMEEFLKSLYSEKLIDFNIREQKWEWDCVRIESVGFTDNVVELMAGKIQNLDNSVQSVLKLSSCIGNKFDLKTLSIINEISQKQAARFLASAVNEGFILSDRDIHKIIQHDSFENESIEFRFAHDRIQQAAYSLIPEPDREKTHYKTGRLILNSLSEPEKEKRIFDIVSQLNAGMALINDEERTYTARLNYKAGKKARASAAFEQAFDYFAKGSGLLNEKNLETDYDLMFSLGLGAAETSYLTGEFLRTEQLIKKMLRYARSLTDKSKVFEIRIMSYIAQNRLQEAVMSGLEILEQLGVKFPKKPGNLSVIFELVKTKLALRGKDNNDLINLPLMSNQNMIAAMRILMVISSPAYISTDIYSLIALKLVSLTLKYGNTPESFFAYSAYSIILCGATDDFDTAYRFGRLGIELTDKFNALNTKTKVIMIFNIFIRHWKEHMKEALPSYMEAYKTGLEYGDLEYGCYCLYMQGAQSFLTGDELSGLRQAMEQSAGQLVQLRQKPSFYMLQFWNQAVNNLIEKTDNPCFLSGSVCNEDELISELVETDHRLGLFTIYFLKSVLNYMFQNYLQAVKNANLAEKYLKSASATPFIMILPFYDTLAYLAVYNQASENEKKKILKKVAANVKKLKKYAATSPMNCLNKLYLAQAEQARVLNQYPGKLYEKSIMLAKENGFVHEEAIANELAAKYYMSEEMTTVAKAYLQNAHAAYRRWGAKTKVLQMEKNFGLFMQETPYHSPGSQKNTETAGKSFESDILDLKTVMKAANAISGEIILEKLLQRMMGIIIESAAAERGELILEREGQWFIEAQARTEAEKSADETKISVLQSEPLEKNENISHSIIRYVERTKEHVVLKDAVNEGQFKDDPYIVKNRPKSVMCAPVIHHGKLIGMIYLENNLSFGAFTPDRLQILNLLTSQAAISLENAKIYNEIENQVMERTSQLNDSLKKITQSIEYARKIQTSMMPKADEVKEYLPNSFIIWMPRDIVGGDIYHMDLFEDGSILAAVVDCTGHGVPGAFVSMIASSFLRKIAKSDHFNEPSYILKQLNVIVKTSLQQEKKETASDDGMDAAICIISPDKRRLTFSGAKLHLVYVINGNAVILKGDRHSIGYKRSDPNFDFMDHTVEIENGMSFYMYSDGFKDQFGGNKGSSFGTRRLKNLLAEISALPFKEQKMKLSEAFDAYKGDNERQDDVTIIGFGFSF